MSGLSFTEAKVVYAPIGMKPNKNGEMKQSFVRLGIKVTFDNGVKIDGETGPNGYAFYTFRHDSVSITRPAMPQRDSLNRVVKVKGKIQWEEQPKNSNKLKEFKKKFSPAFVALVTMGMVAAIQDEAEKRAA